MRNEPELSKSQTEIKIPGASINYIICTMENIQGIIRRVRFSKIGIPVVNAGDS